MAKEIPQVLKGFRDYLPEEQIARKNIISKISEVFERFGFTPMDTPALEPYELLSGKIGEDEKLIYKFKDLGDRDVALRYDLTLPLVRVMANNQNLLQPFKRYQIGNSWRAENTQKGRFREFTQCDVDIVGSDSILADAEVIATLAAAFQELEIGAVKVKYNNRQIVDEVLGSKNKTEFLRIVDKLDKIGEEKVKDMLKAQAISVGLDEYREQMRTKASTFVSQFESYLIDLGVQNFEFEPTLARGLDYYTGTVFEFVLSDKSEFGSIAGGGRYNNLIGTISGKDVPAVGGSIGLDRLFAALEATGKLEKKNTAEVIVFNLDEKLVDKYLQITTDLRNAGINAEFYFDAAKMDKQFKYAEAKNAKVAVIYGPEEDKNSKVNVKKLEAKEQTTVEFNELVKKVKELLS